MPSRNKLQYRFIILSAIVAIAGISVAPTAYDRGWIQFNHPDGNRFPLRGIDVSHHQGHIDWPTVARSGYRFVYIKATEGGDFTDAQFHRNWDESARAGFIRGGYHFYTLCRPPWDQARHLIATLPRSPDMLPPAIDLEFGGNCSKRPAPDEFREELNLFLKLIKDHYGLDPVIYTTDEFFSQYGEPTWRNRLWIRNIFFEPTDFNGWIFWQYYSRARVPGIDGPVDVNVFYGSHTDLNRLRQETIDTNH